MIREGKLTEMCRSCNSYFFAGTAKDLAGRTVMHQTAHACLVEDCTRALCPGCFRNLGKCSEHQQS